MQRDERKCSAKANVTSRMLIDGAERRRNHDRSLRSSKRHELLMLSRMMYQNPSSGGGGVADPAVLADRLLRGVNVSESLGDCLFILSSPEVGDDAAEAFADRLVGYGALRVALQLLCDEAASVHSTSDVRLLAVMLIGAVDSAASVEAVWQEGTMRDPRLLPLLYAEALRGGRSRSFVVDVLNKMWQLERGCRSALGCQETGGFFEHLCSEGPSGVDVASRLASTLARFDYRDDGAVSQEVLARLLRALAVGIRNCVDAVHEEPTTAPENDSLCAAWFEMLDDWAEQHWETVRACVDPKLLLLALGMRHAAVACMDMLTHFRADVEDMGALVLPFVCRIVEHGSRAMLRASLRLLAAAPRLAVQLLLDASGGKLLIDTALPILVGSDRQLRLLVLRLCVAICNESREDIVSSWMLDLDEIESKSFEEESELLETLRLQLDEFGSRERESVENSDLPGFNFSLPDEHASWS
jgi:hypothetical protein